ncbi:replication protein [Paenibacillus xanthanilyticus]|uniref:Replication protein n=1 Tax=Paenibacillus xanthanilyticus TaxID=1783531 RepID=A0ABV8KA54_9BACL
MANPQPDKHTRIANELMDIVPFYQFNGSQLRIIIVVWRNTYGWNRKDHDLSLSFIHERTRLSEGTVKKEISLLIKANVLVVTQKATKTSARRLAFNKNYEAWTIPKSGDDMENFWDYEGSDCTPPIEGEEGSDCTPPEGSDCTPQVATMRGPIAPPKKDILLKTSFKDNVDLFEIFYSTYPRRVSRQAAEKAWKKLAKEPAFNPELIIRNTKNFAKTCELIGTQKHFIPHPSTYLNQKRFEDYHEVDPEGIMKERAPALSKFDQDKLLLQQMYEEATGREGDGSSEDVRDHPLELPEF